MCSQRLLFCSTDVGQIALVRQLRVSLHIGGAWELMFGRCGVWCRRGNTSRFECSIRYTNNIFIGGLGPGSLLSRLLGTLVAPGRRHCQLIVAARLHPGSNAALAGQSAYLW